MRVNEDYETWNAHTQTGDDTSVLAFWKKAIATRKQSDVLASRLTHCQVYDRLKNFTSPITDLRRLRGYLKRFYRRLCVYSHFRERDSVGAFELHQGRDRLSGYCATGHGT